MPPTSIPPGLEVFRDGGEVIIRRPDRNPVAVFCALLSAIFVLVIVITAAKQTAKPNFPFWALNVGAEIYCAYRGLIALVNRTDVVISASGVKRVIGPMFVEGIRSVAAREICGLVVMEPSHWKSKWRFCVWYMDGNNKWRLLCSRFRNREQADFVEHTIREILGMEQGGPQPETPP